MTKVAIVVFTDKVLSDEKLMGKKAYAFNCDNDSVKKGDLIKDVNHYHAMQVVGIRDKTVSIFADSELESLNIQTINGVDVIPEISAPIQYKRNVTIYLEQAIEWFNRGNDTLKELALIAYNEAELVLNYNYILNNVNTVTTTIELPEKNITKIATLIKLNNIANYFNGDWNKTTSNSGYFIGNKPESSVTPKYFVQEIDSKYAIYHHLTVSYPGIVYFKSIGDVLKAVKLMGVDFNNL